MKRTLCLTVFAIGCGLAAGADPFDAPIQPADKPEKKLLHALLAKNKEGQPATKFSSDAPKIYAFWKGDALTMGDKLRAVWIAEGYAGLKDAKIAEGSAKAYKPDDDGAFSLARPKGGWPVGRYRVEIYVGDKLGEILKFKIEPDVTVDVH